LPPEPITNLKSSIFNLQFSVRDRVRCCWAACLFCALLAPAPAFSREKWPAPTQEARRKAEQAKRYEEEVWRRIEPEVIAWGKKGKPFIPSAAKPEDLPQAVIPAFPGAEGAGRFSFGGRGGRVFIITNLADSGPGTLREACESAGPRTVLFNVAGIIHLDMPLHIRAPYMTISGQTAPGDGICIAGQTTHVDTHDVVLRYLRFRRGQTNVFERDDALGGSPVGNIIVDHCSTSWGLDENLSMYRHMFDAADGKPEQKLPTVNITIQWCVSSESLDPYNHAFGATWGGRNTTFHHNLFASNTGRNPSIGMSYDFNFVNNVLFNWRHRTMDGGDQFSLINCINNYYKPGPKTPEAPIRYRILLPNASQSKVDPTPKYGKAYVSGNYVLGNENISRNNWSGGVQFRASGSEEDPKLASNTEAIVQKVRAEKPFPMAPVTIHTAQEAYESVLAGAGATLPRRDAVDERIIQEVRTGKVTYEAGQGIITDISQVGGYPDYKGEPRADLGADGIPASWKAKYGLDPKDGSLADKDVAGDGYTVLEKYLANLDPRKKTEWKQDSH
jgi:pectate lyase